MKRPSFIIIGAMKAATSTVYEQLALQPGIYMLDPKEPNFFSDDCIFNKGQDWYLDLCKGAEDGDLIGEASTHYTKLPTYPDTIKRMRELLPSPRLIYIMRHPIDRLVSQYIHEWTQGIIKCDINEALTTHSELKSYSLYSMQLQPYIDAFGRDSILPVFFQRIKNAPEEEFSRICRFIGYKGSPVWHTDLKPSNISKERIRTFPMYDLVVESKIATWFRRRFIPVEWRELVKNRLRMQQRPELNLTNKALLQKEFDADLKVLGRWLNVELDCENFSSVTTDSLEWTN